MAAPQPVPCDPAAADGWALEESFLDLCIASERVACWLDTIRGVTSQTRQLMALVELAAAVNNSEAYAEEARLAGAVRVLTAYLRTADCEAAISAACLAIAGCSGPLSGAGKMQHLEYAGVCVVVRQGALSDGLGTRVWRAAHCLCWELAEHTELVAGRRVLELGSGTGICGILAAKLDSLQGLDWGAPGGPELPETEFEFRDDDLFEGAKEVEDLGGFLRAAGKSGKQRVWDQGTLRVRFLDWAALQPAAQRASANSELSPAINPNAAGAPVEPGMPPSVDPEERFETIIASDVLYEAPQAKLVAAVVARRLEPGGRALIAVAVRDRALLVAFLAAAAAQGLRKGLWRAPRREGEESPRRGEDYEGGLVLVAAEHEAHPAAAWHRLNAFDVTSVEGLGL
ncbi:hypothetical protein WJX81_000333 [Elliptochloris bilobata]|uniref:Uncharacterized protein n=1 Tax=Elliptochloris bilobata TaxID=381761 RepID=A0AAW1RI23_9CHLO